MKPKEHWIFSNWQKYDPVGLGRMQQTEPEKYKALYNQQFKYGFKHKLSEMMNWSYSDFLAKDQAALQWIKDIHPNLYQQLYKQQFGNHAAKRVGMTMLNNYEVINKLEPGILKSRIVAQNDTINIYLYGEINGWQVNGKKLSEQLQEYENQYTKCNIYLNSDGGSVTEGIAIFNLLSRTSLELTITVDGVAASMSAVLLHVPGAKRYMSKNAKLMMHNVRGVINGTSKELKQLAIVVDDFEASLVEIISGRTGISESNVKAKWFNGKDNWLNAEQALKENLIDGIV